MYAIYIRRSFYVIFFFAPLFKLTQSITTETAVEIRFESTYAVQTPEEPKVPAIGFVIRKTATGRTEYRTNGERRFPCA